MGWRDFTGLFLGHLPEDSLFLKAAFPERERQASGRKHRIPGAEEAIERVRMGMAGAATF
ncbi:MAG: hypothetical protein KY393_06375 [Actinobacteria bacterium]|nr:hypothetical protein [Actinomycetota bacterium]